MTKRRQTRQVRIGNVFCGSKHPITICSMTKTDTRSVKATVRQINELYGCGCEIIRVAVVDERAAKAIKDIKKEIPIPLEADIHFNPLLAIEAIKSGADCIRLNPGNIRDKASLKKILNSAKSNDVSIRVGVNSGSLKPSSSIKDISLQMADSALKYITLFEKQKFYELIVSLKSSDVITTINAYKAMSEKCDYPFHLGVTATGIIPGSIVKSSIGIGTLLLDGIGDTMRVSLTDTPKEEVIVAREILSSLNIRKFDYELISCPTCGRCQVDITKMAKKINSTLEKMVPMAGKKKSSIKVAVMGCVVNGPGEAKDADIGIAAGKGYAALFKKGKLIKRVKEQEIVPTLLNEISKFN